MKLFNVLIIPTLIASTLAVYELRPIPPPLFPNSLCRDFTKVFTQFGSRCILATHFMAPSTPTSVHLWAYDIHCNLVGENSSVSTQDYGSAFYSQLPYAILMDQFLNMTPPSFWYAGMGWGSDFRECWVDKKKRYICSQVFQC